MGTPKRNGYEKKGVRTLARCCRVRGMESDDMEDGEESEGSKDSYPYDNRCGRECVRVEGQWSGVTHSDLRTSLCLALDSSRVPTRVLIGTHKKKKRLINHMINTD